MDNAKEAEDWISALAVTSGRNFDFDWTKPMCIYFDGDCFARLQGAIFQSFDNDLGKSPKRRRLADIRPDLHQACLMQGNIGTEPEDDTAARLENGNGDDRDKDYEEEAPGDPTDKDALPGELASLVYVHCS